jgi:hypothetical protein
MRPQTLLASLLLLSAPAFAQVSTSVMLEHYAPQAGDSDVLGVQSPTISAHLLPRVLGAVSYADAATTLTAAGSLGLFGRVEVGVAVPVVVGSNVELGNLRAQAKVRLVDVGPFSFGASLAISRGGPSVTLLSQWAGPRGSAVLLDVGVGANSAAASLGAKIDLVPRALSVQASVTGQIDLLGVRKSVDALVALRWLPIDGFALTVGAGPGLSQELPSMTVVASIAWVPRESEGAAHPPQSADADRALLDPLPQLATR